MYYEEQWIEGALCWRTSPYGAWTRYTANELAHRYESAEKRAADAQAAVEALQAQLVQEQALNTVRRDAWWQSVKELEAALDAEREKVKGLLRYRVSLDATTPATMDAAETHDRMFNHADRHPEAL